MEKTAITFREIIAPMTREEFLSDYYQKQAVYIPGAAEKFAGVFSWGAFNDILAMNSHWTSRSLEVYLDGKVVPPPDYCYTNAGRDGAQTWQPRHERVVDLMEKGAAIAANYVQTLTPEIRSICQALETVTGYGIACTAFYSRQQKPSYQLHFDAGLHVFAMHVEGEKNWRLYEGRVADAANIPGFRSADYSNDQNRRNAGNVLQHIAMTPGDFLYIPPNQYHEAMSSTESCLHLSFGGRAATGYDLLNLMRDQLPNDPIFRQPMPLYDDGEALRAHLRKMADRLHEIIVDPGTIDGIRQHQHDEAFDWLPVFQLPELKSTANYRVRFPEKRVVRRGPSWALQTNDATIPLEPEEGPFATWLLDREHVTSREIEAVLPNLSADARGGMTERMMAIGLLEKL